MYGINIGPTSIHNQRSEGTVRDSYEHEACTRTQMNICAVIFMCRTEGGAGRQIRLLTTSLPVPARPTPEEY